MSAEEIFARFASGILFLKCDESAETFGLASGVLVSADGYIVTNAHVVEGCRSMKATYINGTSRQSYEPVLKYYDNKSDTAVLKIESRGLDFFRVPARAVRIGERVYDIGNPRGLEQSISEGIVSGNREEGEQLWIQHTAPISPGSSGGALLSSRGELLGINSFLLKESQNLNFAVPAATLARAYLSARALTGFLPFPKSPPITEAEAAPHPAGPPQNPALSTPTPPPTSADGALVFDTGTRPGGGDIINNARDAAVKFTSALQNYVAKQYTARYQTALDRSGRQQWQALDNVTADVIEQDGVEQYKNVLINGRPTKDGNLHGRGRWLSSSRSGTWSEGEFSSLQLDVLSPLSAAVFHGKRSTMIMNRPAFRYDLAVDQRPR